MGTDQAAREALSSTRTPNIAAGGADGDRCTDCPVTPHQRREAMERLVQGAVQAELARSYGVSQSTISRLAAPGPFEASAVGA
jgi:hypothetical protein